MNVTSLLSACQMHDSMMREYDVRDYGCYRVNNKYQPIKQYYTCILQFNCEVMMMKF